MPTEYWLAQRSLDESGDQLVWRRFAARSTRFDAEPTVTTVRSMLPVEICRIPNLSLMKFT